MDYMFRDLDALESFYEGIKSIGIVDKGFKVRMPPGSVVCIT
jgi:hypothetical protein